MKLGKKVAIILIAALVAMGFLILFILREQADAPSSKTNTQSNNQTEEVVLDQEDFDKDRYSLTEPDSLWVIANKNRSLPSDYMPSDLIVPGVRLRLGATEQQMQFRKIAQVDLEAMFSEAAQENVILVLGSGYRSYGLQSQFFKNYSAQYGETAANQFSARPGQSEHQTGLSFDATSPSQTCHLEICFENTPQGKWLAARAHKYGFTLRYKEGKENVTGYQYEPWHFRYIGKELALELFKTGQTLEEFFNLTQN